MVRDLLDEGCHPDAIRLCMVSHHYRQPWTYQDGEVDTVASLLDKLRLAVDAADGEGQPLAPALAEVAFRAAMDDDLDSPAALDIMLQLADDILESAQEGGAVQAAQASLRQMCRVMGLRLDRENPEERVIKGWRLHRARFE
jgi:L-cysteine:1D-myo-inositol 2-amino-2-deoxy-alpha-D-glucopyranoside ligase